MERERKRGRPPGQRSGPRGRTLLILDLLKEHNPAAVARALGITVQAVCYARDTWAGWTPPAPIVLPAA